MVHDMRIAASDDPKNGVGSLDRRDMNVVLLDANGVQRQREQATCQEAEISLANAAEKSDGQGAAREGAFEVEDPSLQLRSDQKHAVPSASVLLRLQLSTYSLLIFITIWGVLARLGLEWIGGFGKKSIFVLIWPQIVGCLFMGIIVERRRGLEELFPPLFTMLGTGFCGSLTTFSSWMVEVFAAFANIDAPSSSRFSGFMNGLALSVATIGLSAGSLLVGSHISQALPAHHQKSAGHRVQPSQYPISFYLIAIAAGPAFYSGAILLCAFGPSSWRSRATFAISFGSPGTILRYYLARNLNASRPTFPLGTFVANLLAVLIFVISVILQRSPGRSPLGCAALQGIQDGFCGSLSTVSTFVVELRALKKRESYRYFFVSWISAQTIAAIVLGSYIWSRDGEEVAMCSF